MQSLTGAILAGGRSRRMHGADKTYLQRDGQRVLRRSIDLLTQICQRVFLVARDAEQAHRLASELQVETLADRFADCGPLGGLATALQASQGPVVLTGCDLPFIELPLLQRLISEFEISKAAATVPRTEQIEPLCSVWSQPCLDQAVQAIRQQKLSMTRFAEEVHARFVDLDSAQAVQLRNINSPEDLATDGLDFVPRN